MFKSKKEQLEERYTRLFGKGQRSKVMVDFFVKRLLGEITDEELEQQVEGIQNEFRYIFETTEPPQFTGPQVGETIYGKLISKEILDSEDAIEK